MRIQQLLGDISRLTLLVSLLWAPALLQAQQTTATEISRSCVYGDCESGFGILEIRTDLGTDRYEGDFQDGRYHGFGRLEQMISRSERAYYEGDWVAGMREGRGTYWDGQSRLYIGQWRDDLRHGRGA